MERIERNTQARRAVRYGRWPNGADVEPSALKRASRVDGSLLLAENDWNDLASGEGLAAIDGAMENGSELQHALAAPRLFVDKPERALDRCGEQRRRRGRIDEGPGAIDQII